jgi:hypothetical protein
MILRKKKNHASSKHHEWQGMPDHASHKEYQLISKEFANKIDKAKANHWKEWIENINGNDIWKVNKYMSAFPTDNSCQWIPHLNCPDGTKTSTSKEKADRLANVFFPNPINLQTQYPHSWNAIPQQHWRLCSPPSQPKEWKKPYRSSTHSRPLANPVYQMQYSNTVPTCSPQYWPRSTLQFVSWTIIPSDSDASIK